MDVDKSNSVSEAEFFRALRQAQIPLSEAASRSVFKELDADGSGVLSYAELCRRFAALSRHPSPDLASAPRSHHLPRVQLQRRRRRRRQRQQLLLLLLLLLLCCHLCRHCGPTPLS